MNRFTIASVAVAALLSVSAFAQTTTQDVAFIAKDDMLKTHAQLLVDRCAKDQFNTDEKAACVHLAIEKAVRSCKSVAGSTNRDEKAACIKVSIETE